MEWMGLNELRESFLSFYEQKKDHLRLDSFPLVPQDDNSLLIINSGMAPMKKWFLGQAVPPRKRVTTCQKCIRTPDIENVGHTARHGTFFEMLGDFSFGDYFKHEVTAWAWEYLTQVLKMPPELLYISVYEEDDEAWDIWTKEVGVDPSHMVRFGKEDNFWEIGSGPCGPCSEIYFDRGLKYGCGKPDCKVGCECDRFIEIWNLVFSEFDGDGEGHYTKLEHPNIDTGMGLERLAVVMQDVDNLFEVDTIQNIMRTVEKMAGVTYKQDPVTDVSIRIICDHIRSTVFMVGDGILPSNAGRGYVLRRLLRRAARHGRMLGIRPNFLSELCDVVVDDNIKSYPNLNENRAYIKRVIAEEEKRFNQTIDAGLNNIGVLVEELRTAGKTVIPGADAFRLQDTFGFPIDLTREIAEENGMTVDEEGFAALLKEQKIRDREAWFKNDNVGWAEDVFADMDGEGSVFKGYDALTATGTVLALAADGERTQAVTIDELEKDGVMVVLDQTPFYAEGGGQVGDAGLLTTQAGASLRVNGCRKTGRGYYVHNCTLEKGTLQVGDKVLAAVDGPRRAATARNHTSAHLLQAALRKVLGGHVHQAGSYVDDNRLRFDFTHFSAPTAQELRAVEDEVNRNILAAIPVTTRQTTLTEAKEQGVTALFGEKYGETVRVVRAGDVSAELCGGTHVDNTSRLGLFKIVSESSVAAGVRRIESVTGEGVLHLMDEKDELLRATAEALKANHVADVAQRAGAVAAELHDAEKALADMTDRLAAREAAALLEKGVAVGAVTVHTGRFAMDGDALRKMGDAVRARRPGAVAVLCGEAGGKATLAVACGADAVAAGVKAGAVAKAVAALAGGNGGGKADFAMAGVKDISLIDKALGGAVDIVKQLLG